jgi:hypothetical protein
MFLMNQIFKKCLNLLCLLPKCNCFWNVKAGGDVGPQSGTTMLKRFAYRTTNDAGCRPDAYRCETQKQRWGQCYELYWIDTTWDIQAWEPWSCVCLKLLHFGCNNMCQSFRQLLYNALTELFAPKKIWGQLSESTAECKDEKRKTNLSILFASDWFGG